MTEPFNLPSACVDLSRRIRWPRPRCVGVPRLPAVVSWREHVAAAKRAAVPDEWATGVAPCPASATRTPASSCVGLAPAAHGGQPHRSCVHRGPRRATSLFAALHRAGFASQPTSRRAPTMGCGSVGAWVAAARAVRAPPANAPAPAERDACRAVPRAGAGPSLAGHRVIVVLLGRRSATTPPGRHRRRCGPGRGSVTASRCRSPTGARSCWRRSTRANRTRSRAG